MSAWWKMAEGEGSKLHSYKGSCLCDDRKREKAKTEGRRKRRLYWRRGIKGRL